MKRISINELFSGIGAQRKALSNLGYDVEVVGISEIDKYAIQSYEAIFGATRNYGDISTVPRLDYADMWTYSFPCQDISVAGNQSGINENTRSGLLYQVQRLLDVASNEGTLPKYLLLENVKNLVGKKFKDQFDTWLLWLDKIGYNNYWAVLNAKDYGVPQNRERVFVLSVRADVDMGYSFPPKEKLEIRLKDVLEENVDEKFYLNNDKIKNLFEHAKGDLIQHLGNTKSGGQKSDIIGTDGICTTLTATDYKQPKQIVDYCICASRGRNPENPSDRTTGAPTEQRLEPNFKGLCNTLTTVAKDNYVVENKIIQVGNIVGTGNWDNPQRGRIYSPDGISPTLNTMQGGGSEPKVTIDAPPDMLRIRKLTPKECWRLMGFDDDDFEKAQASGVSNSQLYKQAGNSIVVNVLEKIFANLNIVEEMDI